MRHFGKFILSMKHKLRTSIQQSAMKYSEESIVPYALSVLKFCQCIMKNTSLGLVVHAGQVLTNPNNYPEKALLGQSFHSLA